MKKTILFILALALGMASCSNNNSSPKETTEKTTTASLDSKAISYDTYTNPRFGFSIMYPTFLSPEPESENGDGQSFSNGKDEEMSVYAGYNVLDNSIEELYQNFQNSIEGIPSHAVQKDNWFEVSGAHSDNTLFYRKTIMVDDVEYTVSVTYPKDKEQLYDGILKKIAESFIVGLEVSYQEN